MTLSLCIAEMSAHTLKIGGSHTFVGESPLGRLGAYLCGVAELLKIIPTGSVCVFAIASYVGHAVTVEAGQRHLVEVGIWFVSYGVFTLLNLMGVEISVNFQVGLLKVHFSSVFDTSSAPATFISLSIAFPSHVSSALPLSYRSPPPSRASPSLSPSIYPAPHS